MLDYSQHYGMLWGPVIDVEGGQVCVWEVRCLADDLTGCLGPTLANHCPTWGRYSRVKKGAEIAFWVLCRNANWQVKGWTFFVLIRLHFLKGKYLKKNVS